LTKKFELGITQHRRHFLRKPALRKTVDNLFKDSTDSIADNLIRLDLKLESEEVKGTRRTKRSKSANDIMLRDQNLELQSATGLKTSGQARRALQDSRYSLESSIIARPQTLGMQLRTAPEPFLRFKLRVAKIVD